VAIVDLPPSGLPDQKIKQVLIVEDDASTEQIWRLIIKRVAYDCVLKWASTYEAAAAHLQQAEIQNSPFDLVISDIYFKGERTGVDLWREYSSSARIFTFASGTTPEKFQSLLGTNELAPKLIPKPIDAKTCIELINTWLATQPRSKSA